MIGVPDIVIWATLAILGGFVGVRVARWLSSHFSRFMPPAKENDQDAREEARQLRERSRQVKADAMRGRPYSSKDFDGAFNLRRSDARRKEDSG